MRFNRSVPPCAVIPVLIYPDPTAAADWLSKAFGFTIRLRIANHRIQMKAGEVALPSLKEMCRPTIRISFRFASKCYSPQRACATERSHHPDGTERATAWRAPVQCSGLLRPQ